MWYLGNKVSVKALGNMVSVNGLLHCVCTTGSFGSGSKDMVLFYFDVVEGRLKKVGQPKYGDGHGQLDRIGLAVLKDELSIYSFPDSKPEIKIWIRQTHGLLLLSSLTQEI